MESGGGADFPRRVRTTYSFLRGTPHSTAAAAVATVAMTVTNARIGGGLGKWNTLGAQIQALILQTGYT